MVLLKSAGDSVDESVTGQVLIKIDTQGDSGTPWVCVYGIFVHQLPCPRAFYVINRRRTPFYNFFDICSRHSSPARGASTNQFLDVKGITYVINYDMPGNIEDYVHRIGRTGRAGTTGTAVSFFSEGNSKLGGDLCKIMREANQTIPPELQRYDRRSFGSHIRYGRGGYGRGRGRGGNGGRGGFRGRQSGSNVQPLGDRRRF